MTTRRNLLRTFAGLSAESLVLLHAASKSNFWESRGPDQWTADDKNTLITNSPWAKTVRADASRAQPVGPPSAASPNSSGAQPGAAPFPAFQGVVRWESAKPVLLALKRNLPDDLAGHYVIGVSGFPLGLHNPQGGVKKEVDVPVNGELDDLRPVTSLRPKGKDAAQAGVVMRSSDSDGPIYLFGFSQDLIALSRSDKSVVFTTEFGPLDIEAKFDPKQMLYRGELAL